MVLAIDRGSMDLSIELEKQVARVDPRISEEMVLEKVIKIHVTDREKLQGAV